MPRLTQSRRRRPRKTREKGADCRPSPEIIASSSSSSSSLARKTLHQSRAELFQIDQIKPKVDGVRNVFHRRGDHFQNGSGGVDLKGPVLDEDVEDDGRDAEDDKGTGRQDAKSRDGRQRTLVVGDSSKSFRGGEDRRCGGSEMVIIDVGGRRFVDGLIAWMMM